MTERKGKNNEAHRWRKSPFNNNEQNHKYNLSEGKKPTSLSSLIVWNVSKAMEKSPNMDIKKAIKAAQERLTDARDINAAICDSAVQRHFTCAMLAWQQLGHSDADSLYQFINVKLKEQEEEQNREAYSLRSSDSAQVEISLSSSQLSKYSKGVLSASFGSNSIGPVIKLPKESKVVMRIEGRHCKKCHGKDRVSDATKTKIAEVCPKKSSCNNRFANLDKEISDLRSRAAMLAKREKERVELLQRAEQAWKDLERGYQRRLSLADEKEEELTKQAQKAVEERNKYKNSCDTLTTELTNIKDAVQRIPLSALDKELCEISCQKLKLSEESAQIDAQLAECHCKTTQLERDLQFKEDQARRKMQSFQNELESSQAMSNETERAMRAELCALKNQVEKVSKQLLEEDAENILIKKEIEELRDEKMGMVEDLESCKERCDARMQGQMDELKKKQEQYAKLNERVTECRCKLPVDVVVEVKRTASLAALCHCSLEDRVLKSCSCTSMRSRLMSTLLSDLFNGLQSEMGGAGQQMPCQMLKCLEDKHNWDKSSVVKTNLENYFAKLLIGELDIAIATSIEKYHAKWVGTSCADRIKSETRKGEDEGWQQRAIEKRAQNLAQGLAEQLFEERAEQLEQRAKDIIMSGPPPCECSPFDSQKPSKGSKGRDEAAYPVLTSVRLCKLPPHKVTTSSPTKRGRESIVPHVSWRSAMHDVTKLKEQIECLNKESIKKADLKMMEENITKIVQQSSSVIPEVLADTKVNPNVQNDIKVKKEFKNKRVTHIIEPNHNINLQKPILQNKLNNLKKNNQKPLLNQKSENNNNFRQLKKFEQNYSINMCMCSQRRAKKKVINSEIEVEARNRLSKNIVPAIPSSVKQTKPIYSNLQTNSKCKCNGVCFHKAPSNTSIDQLLETLAKWNKDSENEREFCNLIPGGCPKRISKKEKHDVKNEADTKMETVNQQQLNEKIERSQSQSDIYKSLEIKKRSSNDINSNDINKEIIIKKYKGSKSTQPSTKDGADISPLTEYPQPITEKQEPSQSRSHSPDTSEIKTISSDSLNKDKNQKLFNNKRNIAELPLRDTDVIPPTESKYMGEINLDKSFEEVCKCSKCHNVSPSTKALQCLPCLCKSKKLTTITKEDHSGDRERVSGDKPVALEQKEFSGHKNINADNASIGDTKTAIGCTKISADNKSIKTHEDNKRNTSSDSYDIKFLGVTLTAVGSQNKKNANKEDPIIMTLETKEEAGDQADTQSCKETISRNIKEEKSNIYDKKCTGSVFQSQQTNVDKGLSIQHFERYQIQDTPCVCCSYKNMNGSEDLEENTFHLLEEHLKEKLQEFKQTSCNDTCIPSEEEEKLFSAILSRVKKLITESTNKITCKCSKEDGTSQGSWDRAYGLLQEYLKTKIKRVQCSCVLAEENNDTILPDVLDKVFQLIEYDFKRLQDICGCKMALELRNSKVCFRDDIPERDEGYMKPQNNKINSELSKIAQSIIIKKGSNSSARIRGETNNVEMYSNKVKNIEAQQNTEQDSNVNSDVKLLEVQESKETTDKKNFQILNLPNIGYVPDCVCTNFECSINGLPDNCNETVKTVFTKPITKHDTIVSEKRTAIFNTKHIQETPFDQVKQASQILNKETEPLVKIVSTADKIANTDLLNETDAQLKSINKMKTTTRQDNCTCCSSISTPQTFSRPYIGYTIECSCDAALAPCYCSKSVFRNKRSDMDNIIKKLQEEKIYHEYDYKAKEKERLTMDKDGIQTQSLSEMNGDMFLHKILHRKTSYPEDRQDRETEVSSHEEDGLILKDSRDYFTSAHNNTNTSDDIVSLTNNYSPQDWRGSHMRRGVSHSDQLSHSYYNPDEFENSVDTKNDNTVSSFEFQEKCSCDMVPICHVKMLVENIENRLVTANCTCDSMIPQVCPIHSMK